MSHRSISAREFIDEYFQVVGVNSDNECAYQLLNQARNLAYPLGDWVGTMDHRLINVTNGCFVLPSDLELIRGARNCYGDIIPIDLGHVTKDFYNHCDPQPLIVKSIGRIYSPFQSTENLPIYFHAVNGKDIGKEIRVQYLGTRGARYEDTITLRHLKPTKLKNHAARILRITKPRTVGLVAVYYGSDSNNPSGVDYILAADTNPSYTVYKSECAGTIAIESKKRMMPLSLDSADDVLDIHPEALASFITAIRARDERKDGWLNNYSAAVSLGVNYLKQEQINEAATNDGDIPVQYVSQLTNDLVDLQNL
jgi:hypothetical protein